MFGYPLRGNTGGDVPLFWADKVILTLPCKWCLVWFDPTFSKQESISYECQILSSSVTSDKRGCMLHSMGRMDRKAHHPHPTVVAPTRYLPLAKVIIILSYSESSSFSCQLKLQWLQDRSGEGMESHPRAIDRVSLWLPEEGHRHIQEPWPVMEKKIHPQSIKGPLPRHWHFLWKSVWLQRGHGRCEHTDMD